MIDEEQKTTDIEQNGGVLPPRHRRPDKSQDKYFKIRNVLNIIFMLGAIVGMAIFYFQDRTLGTIIILTAIAFKIAECRFRFIRQ